LNVQQQIAKLESLLGRIQRNAASGRPHAGATAAGESPALAEPSPPSALPLTARAAMPSPEPPVAEPPRSAVVTASVEVEEIDMMDAEIVELGAEASETGGEESDLEADFGGLEPIPESAPRPAAQFDADELDLEPPVKTPPPESGRQFVTPAPGSSSAFAGEEADLGGADVDALLETDSSRGHISKAPPGGPSMEQLGETVELEGADAPDASLDLEPVTEDAIEEVPPDELELSLPKQGFRGAYDEHLSPPAEALADLDRHRREIAVEAKPQVAPAPASPAISARPEPPASPIVVERPASAATHVAEVVMAKPTSLPSTFLELLDVSLSLKPRS